MHKGVQGLLDHSTLGRGSPPRCTAVIVAPMPSMPLQAENGALQGLVVDMAANKAEARRRLADLKEKYQHLLQVTRA